MDFPKIGEGEKNVRWCTQSQSLVQDISDSVEGVERFHPSALLPSHALEPPACAARASGGEEEAAEGLEVSGLGSG